MAEEGFALTAMPSRVVRFAVRVVVAFLRNRGVLLAGGVGYSALLSIVPFVTLTLTILSSFSEEARILDALRHELELTLPKHADGLLKAAQTFLEHSVATSAVSIFALLFFSANAFRMLAAAISIIFRASGSTARRSGWLSALLPFLFMLLLIVSVLALTVLASLASGSSLATLGGLAVSPSPTARLWLRQATFAGLVVLFTGTYKLVPAGRVPLRLALLGGLCAAILWRGVGLLLSWYFASLSMVNVIYGSLATVVVLLLYMEAAFIVVLLGAQMVAELKASAAAGVPWHVEPGRWTG